MINDYVKSVSPSALRSGSGVQLLSYDTNLSPFTIALTRLHHFPFHKRMASPFTQQKYHLTMSYWQAREYTESQSPISSDWRTSSRCISHLPKPFTPTQLYSERDLPERSWTWKWAEQEEAMMTDPHHLKVKIENNPLLAFTDRSLTEGGVATTC